jgi:HD superfamily phosphohydrolase YqeK
MSLLEKIIYLADYLEEGRSGDCINELRQLVFSNLDRTLEIVLEKTLKYLIENNRIVHKDSIEAWNYLIINKGV